MLVLLQGFRATLPENYPTRETQIAQEPEPAPQPADARGWVRRFYAAIPFEPTVFGIFAVLLALVTLRHEMWRDEVQAWLIALNTHSIPQLVHALSYEGHPALWYLLLWIPSHFSPNPAGMQVVNFLIALATAWMIVSAVKLPRAVRVLLIFSYFVFYRYGVTARSYELAVLLLIGAACCLLGERRRPWLAILLLALSIIHMSSRFPWPLCWHSGRFIWQSSADGTRPAECCLTASF